MTRETTGLLAQAARAVVRAGGEVRLPALAATWRTFSVAGQVFPFDLVPAVQSSGKRSVDLQTEGHWAETATLVFSYETRNEPMASVLVGTVPVPVADRFPRRHAALVRFGTGQATHAIEVDVAEGTALAVPTQSIEVTMLSYGAVFPTIPQVPPMLASMASAAYGAGGIGVKTMDCLVPLGLFALPGAGGAGVPLPLLREADDEIAVQAAFVAAMARPAAAGNTNTAFWAAVDRVLALVPPTAPIGVP